jgi:hypothetical protein
VGLDVDGGVRVDDDRMYSCVCILDAHIGRVGPCWACTPSSVIPPPTRGTAVSTSLLGGSSSLAMLCSTRPVQC